MQGTSLFPGGDEAPPQPPLVLAHHGTDVALRGADRRLDDDVTARVEGDADAGAPPAAAADFHGDFSNEQTRVHSLARARGRVGRWRRHGRAS